MEKYKIQLNEQFFDTLLFVLREGGIWEWKDSRLIFIKTGGKFLGSPAALEEVHKIVSKKYFKKNFGILKLNS